MSAEGIITAYDIAVPSKQQQNLPGLDKEIKPGMEYTKIECWDDAGRPFLKEYTGSGKLQGKTAIVTGGDSGIGRAAAIMFAREGCSGITISCLPEEEVDAKDARRLIEASGAKCNVFKADLMEDTACEELVQSHVEAFGKLNVLVNNAALFKNMQGLRPDRPEEAQLAPKGIRVNGVAPGPVITASQAASRPADNMEGLGVGLPLHGRAGQPAEVGPAYVFLASSDSNIMTGQVIHVNSKFPHEAAKYRSYLTWTPKAEST